MTRPTRGRRGDAAMPELPEATVIAGQLHDELRGATVASVEVRQPKCLNLPPDRFISVLTGASLGGARARGKWILLETDRAYRLALNLGMGGEILLRGPDDPLPAKLAVRFGLADARQIAISFWWFGYVHLAVDLPTTVLAGNEAHPVDRLGPTPLELDLAGFRAVLAASPRAALKTVLLDQKRISGIGNVTVQDPLWMARLHPLRKAGSLSPAESAGLFDALCERLQAAIVRGGSRHEQDLYGNYGGWGLDDYFVGYRTGERCPRCGKAIAKVKTGATSSYICPDCQQLPPI